MGSPVQIEQPPRVPSLCAAKSEREFVDAGNQTQDIEQIGSGSEFEDDGTYRSTISPFSFSILADCVGGFRRATVRLEVVGFLVAHKIKDSNDLCGSCDHLSRAGVAGRRWGVDFTQMPLSMAVAIFWTHTFVFSRSRAVLSSSSDLYFVDTLVKTGLWRESWLGYSLKITPLSPSLFEDILLPRHVHFLHSSLREPHNNHVLRLASSVRSL